MTALESPISPAAAVAKLAEAGITISERTLRERARQLGACRVIGKTMFLLPEDIDRIFSAAKPEPKPCRTSPSEANSTTTISPSMESDIASLRERLIKGSRKTSRSKQKTSSVVLLSTVKKRS